jgi:hypothetical protein
MMQMLEPDFWKGKGRYSKQACKKAAVDQRPISPNSPQAESENQNDRN